MTEREAGARPARAEGATRGGAGVGGAGRALIAALVVLALGLGCQGEARAGGLPVERIELPPGFEIEVFAEGVAGARSMTLGAEGTLFVGTRREGKVYALRDEDGDGRAEARWVIAQGLDTPNGVAMHEGDLYVALIDRVLRYEAIESRLEAPPTPEVIRADFPSDRMHGWKFIAFGPDGWLYVPVGAPCNACEGESPRHATITRMRPDGSGLEIYAEGVRNTVGFDWRPETGVLYFTDNGRDHLGDDRPPDELNRAPEAGLDFGYPGCHGADLVDPERGGPGACEETVAPVQALGPHVAALGMRFYAGEMFPPAYRGGVFIAEHGSWNRETPIGYRVSVVRLDDAGRSLGYDVFASGWLGEDGEAWGRPVDVLVMPDGALLVSDDRAGAVYRIRHAGE